MICRCGHERSGHIEGICTATDEYGVCDCIEFVLRGTRAKPGEGTRNDALDRPTVASLDSSPPGKDARLKDFIGKDDEDVILLRIAAEEIIAKCLTEYTTTRCMAFGPGTATGTGIKRGIQVKRLPQILKLMSLGLGNRAIVRAAGINITTVAKIRAACESHRGEPFLCKCGKNATHRGWCRYRLEFSKSRKAFLKQWTDRQREQKKESLAAAQPQE